MRIKKRTKKNLEKAKKLMQQYCDKDVHSISQIREYLRNKGYAISKTTLLKWYSNMKIVKRNPTVEKQIKIITQKQAESSKKDSETFDAFLSTAYLEFLLDFANEVDRCLHQLREKEMLPEKRIQTMQYVLKWKKKYDMLKLQFENRKNNPLNNVEIKQNILIKVPRIQREGRKKYEYRIDLTGKRPMTRERHKLAKEMKAAWSRGLIMREQLFKERAKDIAKIHKRREKEGKLRNKYD
ncbi:MAG: hypothetical protein IMZ52_01310 [Actinobacteria bacterium]|nr:hypothetical protein [Actinomycetota bacterium]MBE3121494.1 hypothetical protein [Thermoplasmata archaeon]